MMLRAVCRPAEPRGDVTTRHLFTGDLVWSRPWMGYDAMAGHLAVGCSGFIGVQTLVSDDLEIIRRVLQGEIDRFAELITRYQQHVAKITNRHVPSDSVAEVAHDVFVRAYSSLSSFSGQTPFEHWLSGIAVRTCYDFWRARRREELPVSSLATEHQAWMDHVLAAVPQRFTLVGYSMGGRIALHVALAAPARVARLVLVASTAGIEDERQRALRREADAALAREFERSTIEQVADRWMAQPLFAAEPAAARAIHARIMPLMQINFVESSPGPVKAAMAAMGLIEEVYRLPLVAPRAESKERISSVLKDLGVLKAALV